MTEKKTTSKTTPKTKAEPKGTQSGTATKKTRKKASVKATEPKKAPPKGDKKPEIPGWVKKSPTEHIIGTTEYRMLVAYHNEHFGTHYNPWRVQPQVFISIHQRVKDHFNDKK